jgi:uncharacterized membrane protein YidH (DUF202 family)
MKCPVCSAELPATAKFCGGCGTTLSAPPPPAAPPPASFQQPYPLSNPAPAYGGGGFGGSAMPAVKRKYKVLRLIAVLMKILSVVIGALLIIGGLVMAVAGAAASSQTTSTFSTQTGPGSLFTGLFGGLIMLVYGVFVFVFLYAYAEWMYVFMDIEENTRMTNEMLMGRK